MSERGADFFSSSTAEPDSIAGRALDRTTRRAGGELGADTSLLFPLHTDLDRWGQAAMASLETREEHLLRERNGWTRIDRAKGQTETGATRFEVMPSRGSRQLGSFALVCV